MPPSFDSLQVSTILAQLCAKSLKSSTNIPTYLPSNTAGEIKGKTAAQGKIGQGAINDVLKSFNKTPLLPPKEIQTLFNNKDKGLIADFYKNYNKIVEGINEDDFNELLEERDLNYLVSKYLSTKLASIILDDTQNQDEIVSDMIRYASSSTKSSSVFVKVS